MEEYQKHVYLYEKTDYRKLGRLLSIKKERIELNEYLNCQDVEMVWDKFIKKFQEAINDCVPKKKFVRRERPSHL